jgi:hypothetical protein
MKVAVWVTRTVLSLLILDIPDSRNQITALFLNIFEAPSSQNTSTKALFPSSTELALLTPCFPQS